MHGRNRISADQVRYMVEYFAGVMARLQKDGPLGEEEDLESTTWVRVSEGSPPMPNFDRWAMYNGMRDWPPDQAETTEQDLRDTFAVLREHDPATLPVEAFEELMASWQDGDPDKLRAACVALREAARR